MLQIKICPTCGSHRIHSVTDSLQRKHGGACYMVKEVTFYECPNCGERLYDREAMRKIEAARHRLASAKRAKATRKSA